MYRPQFLFSIMYLGKINIMFLTFVFFSSLNSVKFHFLYFSESICFLMKENQQQLDRIFPLLSTIHSQPHYQEAYKVFFWGAFNFRHIHKFMHAPPSLVIVIFNKVISTNSSHQTKYRTLKIIYNQSRLSLPQIPASHDTCPKYPSS